MKTAYQYIRISDDDQSNFSISGQEKYNNDYAAKHGIQIIKKFVDDGYSAKDFNRPQWKILEKELSKNKTKIDFLIVVKYDRLIRKAADGLAFVEKLEDKWDIKLLSAMESFFIDPHSPYFFKMRADLFVNAEFERRVIADRTKFGNWSAKNQGRYIGMAPIGYVNARDEDDLPIIKINELQRPIIEDVFSEFLNNTSYSLIIKKVKGRGITLKGHGSIPRIISNPVYAGLIKTPNYKDETSKIIKGLHDAIIDENLYWKAFYKLQDLTKPQGPKVIDENVPLRGFIKCKGCGGYMTGGKSKGRTQFYNYYRCKKCLGENYNADKVHGELIEILKNLSLEDKFVNQLKISTKTKFDEVIKERNARLKKARADHDELVQKLNSLEGKYINDKINQDTYDKWFPLFNKEVKLKLVEIGELESDDRSKIESYNSALPMLTDLVSIYNKASVEQKMGFLKGIFWGGFTKEKIGGRTGILNPMFTQNSLKISTLLRVDKAEKPEINSGFSFCTQEETRTPTPYGIRTSSVLVYHSNTWACYTFWQKPEQTFKLPQRCNFFRNKIKRFFILCEFFDL